LKVNGTKSQFIKHLLTFNQQTSTFLPRILGALMLFAGLGGLTSLSPRLAIYLSRYIGVPGFLAELSLCLWLLVMGVGNRGTDGTFSGVYAPATDASKQARWGSGPLPKAGPTSAGW
jgi:hypothetical protein